MRDAWLYTKNREAARDLGSALVELGYRPRVIGEGETLRPSADGALSTRPPEIAIVVTGTGEELQLDLLSRLRSATELSEAPVLLAIDPDHLRATPDLASAHEILVRPFSVAELRLRLARAMREIRSGSDGDVLREGPLELNLATYRVSVDRRPVELRFMEYELLKFLMTHPDRAFTREALLARVWGYDYYGGARTVDVHVRRVRVKIGEAAARIKTVRSVGYLFDSGRLLAAA